MKIMQKTWDYKMMTLTKKKIAPKCRLEMVSIMLAFPNPSQVHQY